MPTRHGCPTSPSSICAASATLTVWRIPQKLPYTQLRKETPESLFSTVSYTNLTVKLFYINTIQLKIPIFNKKAQINEPFCHLHVKFLMRHKI